MTPADPTAGQSASALFAWSAVILAVSAILTEIAGRMFGVPRPKWRGWFPKDPE